LRINPDETILIPTGFKTSFVNAVLKVYVRSSISLDGLQLANSVGIIDSDYRGELFLAVKNTTNKVKTIADNQRIAQGILEPLHQCGIEEGTVDITDRGAGGFGSTN
jgi:dUTP pyrophosphatase